MQLEPIFFEPNFLIIDELDEFSEVIFPMEGTYKVGYSINKKEYYVDKFGLNVIGAYGVTFNKRALFLYKSITHINGYFIRKINWLD